MTTALGVVLVLGALWVWSRHMRALSRRHSASAADRACPPRASLGDAQPAVAGPTTDRADPAPLAPAEPAVGSTDDPTQKRADQPPPVHAQAIGVARLAGTFERARRLLVAEERVELKLAQLPQDAWLVERYVRIGDTRVPFVIVGPPGMFVLSATDTGWAPAQLQRLAEASQRLCARAPRLSPHTFSGTCLAFEEMAPRCWFDAKAPHTGGWVLGIDSLRRWLTGVNADGGIDPEAIHALQDAAGPFWGRATARRLPTTPYLG